MRKIAFLMAALLGAAGGAVAEENATPLAEGEITGSTLPGTVLLHNHHYTVKGTEPTIDATPFAGMSALRVPAGASVLLEIPEGTTLTLIGGPGFGRIPGGAGIEVPFGSKLVICGGGTLNAIGGAAASGGKGYGGMGGRRCFASNLNSLPDSMKKAYKVPGFKPEDLPFCDKKPLPYNVTGAGGDGGDGGGGAGVGIGGKGGAGGKGGQGGPSEMIVYGPTYKSRETDYRSFKNAILRISISPPANPLVMSNPLALQVHNEPPGIIPNFQSVS